MIARIRKALTAAVTAAAGAVGTAWADGVLTDKEWIGIVAVALVAGWAVWKVRNAPEPVTRPSVHRADTL